MVEKIHNGPWPAIMALGEKSQPLGVEILVRHLSLGRTKGRSNQHRSNRSPPAPQAQVYRRRRLRILARTSQTLRRR